MRFKAFLTAFLATALAWPLAVQAEVGGPDRGGYEWADNQGTDPTVTYAWQNIEEDDRTYETLGDDDESAAITLPSAFTFYGTAYNTIYVGSNGFVSFQSNSHDLGFVGQCPLPVEDAGDINTPDLAIYGFYQDLNPTEETGAENLIYHGAVTDGDVNMYVITWEDVEIFQWAGEEREPEGPVGTDPVTFQIVLYLDTNEIQVNIDEAGERAGLPRWTENTSIGIENIDGTIGLGKCDWEAGALIPEDYAVRFFESDGAGLFPPSQSAISTPGETVTFDLDVLNFSDAAVTAAITVASESDWTATAIPASLTVAADTTESFAVDVEIPETATAADSAVFTVTVTIGDDTFEATLEIGLTHPDDEWQIISELPDNVRYPVVVSDGTYLYAIGGEYTEVEGDMIMFNLVDTVYRYDPAENQWNACGDDVAQLPYTVSRSSGCYMNGTIYVVGGLQALGDGEGTPAQFVPDMLAYDVAGNTWSTMTAPPSLVSNARVVCDADADLVYVLGGWVDVDGNGAFELVGDETPDNEDNSIPIIQVYDATADSWDDTLTAPDSAAVDSMVALVDGEIIVAGGNFQEYQEDSSSWGYFITRGTSIYDIATDAWREGGFMEDFLADGASVVFEDQFCIVGGQLNDGTPLEGWQCYSEPLWITQVDNLSYGRFGMGAVVQDGYIYAIAGAATTDQTVDRSERWPLGELAEAQDPIECDGDADGDSDGDGDGDADGDGDGDADGDGDGDADGDADGDGDGDGDGDDDGDDGCNCSATGARQLGDAMPALMLVGLLMVLRRRDR